MLQTVNIVLSEQISELPDFRLQLVFTTPSLCTAFVKCVPVRINASIAFLGCSSYQIELRLKAYPQHRYMWSDIPEGAPEKLALPLNSDTALGIFFIIYDLTRTAPSTEVLASRSSVDVYKITGFKI